jgi:hypothetical protein
MGRDGQGLNVRRLSVDEALSALPLVYKNLGAFDLDRSPGTGVSDAERACYRELFGRVTVLEVTGRVDFTGSSPSSTTCCPDRRLGRPGPVTQDLPPRHRPVTPCADTPGG